MKKIMLVMTLVLFVVSLNFDIIALADNPSEDDPPINYDDVTLTIKSRMFSENGMPVDGRASIQVREDLVTTAQYLFPNVANTWTHETQVENDPRHIPPTYDWRSYVRATFNNQSTFRISNFTSDDTHVHIYSW